jgi:hypothetical protein
LSSHASGENALDIIDDLGTFDQCSGIVLGLEEGVYDER